MWNAREAKWEEMFALLQDYLKQNGDTRVPAKAGPLGRWVAHQRELYRKSGLDSDLARRLEELSGWEWSLR